MISKLANSDQHFRHYYYGFKTAREAFQYLLISFKQENKKILLPGYIGFSTREGSGVYDPIKNSKIDHEFYHLDKHLNIDLSDLKLKFKKNKNAILLLIHYFGFRDPAYVEIKKLAAKNKIIVIEDYAHGLYTFFNQKIVPFDLAFFSLHKMLPQKEGGILVTNNQLELKEDTQFLSNDLTAISAKRIKNYQIIKAELIKNKSVAIKILKPNLKDNVPQTFPIILKSEALRDRLYFSLNQKGFGVVSLYHEMISEIDSSFSNERYVSQHILNLPIHQEADESQLKLMINELLKEIKLFKTK